jgi:N-acetylglucosamine malate deacetylase 1
MHPISRRKLFQSAIVIPVVTALAQRKLKVVVTGGHPGDPEYGCGGTIARYAGSGHEVTLLYLNRGEKGCPEKNPAEGSSMRVAEARKACEILKARAVFAGQCDAHTVVDRDRYEEFRVLLADEKPDVVFTHWPIDNHPDHRAISMLAYDAWIKLGKKFGFYYYEVSNGADTLMFTPTDYVDIGGTEERKRAACYAHASQTPGRFYALQSQVTRFRGIEAGYAHAEAFIRHIHSPNNLLP